MSFDFDLALSEFKKFWDETPLNVKKEVKDKILKTIKSDDFNDTESPKVKTIIWNGNRYLACISSLKIRLLPHEQEKKIVVSVVQMSDDICTVLNKFIIDETNYNQIMTKDDFDNFMNVSLIWQMKNYFWIDNNYGEIIMTDIKLKLDQDEVIFDLDKIIDLSVEKYIETMRENK